MAWSGAQVAEMQTCICTAADSCNARCNCALTPVLGQTLGQYCVSKVLMHKIVTRDWEPFTKYRFRPDYTVSGAKHNES